MIRADTDPDMFVAEVHELRDERSDLNEVVSTDCMATAIFDALPAEKYLTITIQAMSNPDLSLGEVKSMMKEISLNHSQRSSVKKKETNVIPYGCDSGRALTMRDRVTNLHCSLS